MKIITGKYHILNIFEINKHLSVLEKCLYSGCKKTKNHISHFRNCFLILYVSKIKFRKSILREKCSMNLKKSFSNLIFQNNTECQKQSEN